MAAVTVHDVAKYILSKRHPVSAMKLQKLLYYCQAWSLVFDEAPLFKEPIEAWAMGPVVRDAYEIHRGHFSISSWPKGKKSKLSADQRETVDVVLQFYGDKTAQWLSDLTHSERPWRDARKGLAPDERGNTVISDEAMAEYYSSLEAN